MLGSKKKERKYIEDLPWSVVRKLTQLLDRPQPQHHNWSTLLAHTDIIGLEFTAEQVSNFQTIANRAIGSPSEAIINDFSVRNVTIDNLYCILRDMEHIKGMELLKDYVSSQVKEPQNEDDLPLPPPTTTTTSTTTTTGSGSSDGTSNSNGNSDSSTATNNTIQLSSIHQYHPDIGPLPNNVPLTEQDVIIRAPQEHPHMSSSHNYGYFSHTHNSSSPTSSFSPPTTNLYHPVHSPVPNNYFFSHQTTPTAQFSSPPPPPYSPHIPNHHPNDRFHDDFSSPTPHHPHVHRPVSSPLGDNGVLPQGPPQPPNHSTNQWRERQDISTQLGNVHITNGRNNEASGSEVSAAPQPASDFKLSILRFPYADLSNATKIFTDGLVGHGAFGSVFKANVRGCGTYAIKKLHNRSEMQSEMEGTLFFEPLHQESFMLELQSLVKYKHRNILSLVAISDDGPRPCLVYEYMENGSLADCLLDKHKSVMLTCKLRMEIASQIADALNFLHVVNEPKSLIHGDVKSSNILLDKHLTPKLSDFGLARECVNRPNHTSLSTNSRVAMGTVAYMAPEFLRNSKPSSKTDVYAFGVVMLELFTGQAPDDPSRDIRTLVYHLQPLFHDPDKNREMINHEADARISWPSSDTSLGFFVIATFCLQGKPKKRPPMDQVRDQITMLMDEAMMQPVYPAHVNGGGPQQFSRWN